MGSPETFTIDGKEMKRCPGWQGNDFRCGRGDPRLIPVAKEVCEGCSRGMRKRGQATREEEQREAQKQREEEQAVERGLAIIRKAFARPLTKGEVAAIRTIIEASDKLVTKDLRPGSYWNESIGRNEKWELLRALVEAGPEPKRSRL